MSQKKVDAYKKEKANREQIIKKEKRILKAGEASGCGGWSGPCVLGWILHIRQGDRGGYCNTERDGFGHRSSGQLSERACDRFRGCSCGITLYCKKKEKEAGF